MESNWRLNPWRYGYPFVLPPYNVFPPGSDDMLCAQLALTPTIVVTNWSDGLDAYAVWQLLMGPSGRYIALSPIGIGPTLGQRFPYHYDVLPDA